MANMRNLLNIARKEILDLLNSWIVIVILVIYFLLIIKTVFDTYGVLSQIVVSGDKLADLFIIGIRSILTYYGCFLGVVIGFSSMANERYSNALGTLISKPLYRDTIINGKLLGAMLFLVCIFCLTIALYTSALLIVMGNSFIPVITSYVSSLPFVFGLSLIYVTIFLVLSMLFSLLFNDQTFALAMGVISIFFFDLIPTQVVALPLGHILSSNDEYVQLIAGISPSGIINTISNNLYPPVNSPDILLNTSYSAWVDIIKIVLFMIIPLVLCYIIFLRRDIA